MPSRPARRSRLRVSATYLAAVADWLERAGHGASAACGRIRRLRVDDDLSPEDAERLLAEAATLTGDPLAALHAGRAVEWTHLGALGHLLAGSRTLEDLLSGYVYYEAQFYGLNIANLQREPGHVTLYWTSGAAMPQFSLFSVSSVVAIIRASGIPPECIASVLLPEDATLEAAACSRVLGCEHVTFGRSIGVTVPRAALGRGLVLRTPAADRAAQLAALFPELDDVALRAVLYDAIAAALPHRKADLAHVAGRLAMSPRTLQRRLAAIPDGLRGAIGRVRMHLAETYLRDPTLKLLAVSMLLGYSEQSAFHLAFRKSHGCAPGQWRRERTP